MIELQPMTKEEFEAYVVRSIAEYSAEGVRSGQWHPDEAHAKARQTFNQLLPDGLQSTDHYLFTLRDGETPVGILWFGVRSRGRLEPSAFVYDIYINEEHRRRGFATQAMQALETKVQELGLHRIGLHVFGHNQGARELYEKLGYITTNIQMAKDLDS